MAGKAYTMREMRSIVEYLTEHKAYSEIKGRKMWMEFANSQHTTRTWQSLKETFLKRILPDLHNPYYKLTMDQVRSFREGCDVAEKEKKNRLDLRPVNEDSGSNGPNENKQLNDKNSETKSDDGEATTSKANEVSTANIENELEKATGEAITPANIQSRNRSSADTLVLEYENVEDVQRALESPKHQTENKCKSFKDRLSFEPMTPLLKELLEDFETESETSDKEPPSKIEKKASKDTNNTVSKPMRVDEPKEKSFSDNDADALIVIEDSEDVTNSKSVADTSIEQPDATTAVDIPDKNENNLNSEIIELTDSQDNKNDEIPSDNLQIEHIKQETLLEDQEIRENVTELITAQSIDKTGDISNNNNMEPKSISVNITVTPTQNTGNTSSDTLLPNNQEGLGEPKKKEVSKQISALDKTDNDSKSVNRKRSSSTDNNENNKQKKTETSNVTDDLHGRVTPVIELNTDTPNDTASIIAKNTEIPKDRVIEINTNTSVTNTADEFHAELNNRENTSKPATSTQKDQTEQLNDTKDTLSIETDADKNPCLLNVSLFDDQFKNTQYSDSESDEPKLLPEKNKKELKDIQSSKSSSLKNTENQTKETKLTTIPAVQKTILKQQKETHLNAIEVMELNEVPEKFDILKSNAENNQQKIDQRERANETKPDRKSVMLQKEKTLANLFGFAHGVAAASSSRKAESRKRRISHKRSYRHRRHISISSNSSEWTSESDSDSYVSPPRGRKNRHTRKYLKPKSSRILQDPEEGMLFVMFGKNLYPIVKDGKHIKNFLTYRPDSGDEEDDSYWRQKYVEEKKRVDDYKKLLQKRERNESQDEMPSTSRNHQASYQPEKPCINGNDKHATVEKPEVKNERMVLKIACKSGLEYCLEGGWTQISNAMPQVVQILRTESDTVERKQSPNVNNNVVINSPKPEAMEVSSGVSTPVIPIIDTEVREKVNKIETEIFKEIAEREKEDAKVGEAATNVTKRRGKPRKEKSPSLTTSDKPAKRTRMSKASTESKETISVNNRTSEQKIESETNAEKPANNKLTSTLEVPNDEVQNTNIIQETVQLENPKTNSRTEIKPIVETEPTTADQINTVNLLDQYVTDKESHSLKEQIATRKSQRISKEKETSRRSSVASLSKTPVPIRSSPRKRKTTTKNDDTDSSASDVRQRKSASKATSEMDIDDENARFIFPPAPTNKKSARVNRKRSMPQIHVIPPENITENSIGYQDSNSPINLLKWKRKISFSTQKTRRIRRRKSYPILLQDLSSDSNDSVYFVPLRKSQTTLSSYIYKTDSYRQLFAEKKSVKKLVPIDEAGSQESDDNIRHFHLIAKDSDKINVSMAKEVGSSSNVSLPLSPELSIVEKLTISTEMIRNDNHPILNENQRNSKQISDRLMDFSEFMISNVDVSFPLMDQSCELQRSKLIPNETPSDPLNKQTNVTVSPSLDQRLQDLLLESGKKTTKNKRTASKENKVTTRKTRSKNNENAMDVDETETSVKKDVNRITTRRIRSKNNENAIEANEFKIPVKRRSSTPRKKKTVQNTIVPSDAIIEEERMETCSYNGRKSCPPVVTLLPIDENANNCDEVSPTTKNPKKKKDVIKVKIQRPKSRQKIREKSVGASTITVFTDSGINETDTISGIFLKDDSVDLIHNHSETCLLAHDCLDESVKLIDKSKSIISLNSTAVSDVESELMKLVSDGSNLSGVEFGSPEAPSTSKTSQQNKSCETEFLSPQTINSSLITEDLSNEVPSHPSQWYLLSEDEYTLPIPNVGSFGANLNQIFPITCTVPNLSTITEASKDSRKQSLGDGNICDLFDNDNC